MVGCLVALLAMMLPRVALVGLWLLSDWLDNAYQTVLWPLLGFVFMPYTTLAYALAMNLNQGTVNGVYLVVVVVAVLMDLGSLGGGHLSRRRRRL